LSINQSISYENTNLKSISQCLVGSQKSVPTIYFFVFYIISTKIMNAINKIMYICVNPLPK